MSQKNPWQTLYQERHAQYRTVADDRDWLLAMLLKAREAFRDYHTNWDCDSDAHKYGTTCRVCDAGEMLDRIDSLLAARREKGM